MRAYVITVIEIPGEKNDEFVTSGKYALLRRAMFSAAECASAVVRVVPEATWADCLWTDDVLMGENAEKLEEWQRLLMEATTDDG